MLNPTYKISPSDFAYLWEECRHCYYQKVKNGLTYSSPFPAMFGRINKLLQTSIMGLNLNDIHPNLPNGIVEVQEGYLKSKIIPKTNLFISGRFDILSKLEDGTFAIIDFKITLPDEERILKKYSSQLHAYKFALENPLFEKPVKISKLGAVSINPEEMKLVNGKIVFTTTPAYHSIEENMKSFYELTQEISSVLNGPLPAPSETCALCMYRKGFAKLAEQIKRSDELPF